jgi:hypothetical protein
MRAPIFFTIFFFTIFSAAFSQTFREISKTFPLKSDGRLVIDTYKGSISITTHDKPQIEIKVKIESDDTDPQDAARDIEDTEIDIHSTTNEVTLHSNYRKVERNHDFNFFDWLANPEREISYSLPSTHYTIVMPRRAELRIKDYKSESHIDGVASSITLNTYKGTVEIVDFNGGIDIETYKGNAHISFASFNNDSHFETYKGKITASLPKQCGFELRTDFERHVRFNSDFNVETHEHGRKYSISDYFGKINGGGPTLYFKSTKGDIRLRANEHADGTR